MSDHEREQAERLAEILRKTDADTLDDVYNSYGSFDILLK